MPLPAFLTISHKNDIQAKGQHPRPFRAERRNRKMNRDEVFPFCVPTHQPGTKKGICCVRTFGKEAKNGAAQS